MIPRLLSVPSTRVALALLLLAGATFAHAQDSSVSAPLSDGFSQQSPTDGFTSQIPGGDVTSNSLHTDVSDPTHSQLLGSALSPVDYAYPSTDAASAPVSTAGADSQALSQDNGGIAGGGSRSSGFIAGSATAGKSIASTRSDTTAQAFRNVTSGSAFTTSASRAGFSGLTSRVSNTGQAFSGQGTPALAPQGVGATQTLTATSNGEAPQGYFATDPVLTQQAETSVAPLQLGADMPSPSMLATSEYLEDIPQQATRYEYEDGQTPPIASSVAPRVGTILGAPPEYTASTTGFYDSTKGTAALPMEASNWTSSLTPLRDPGASPFPSVSDGTVFGVHTGLNPTLHGAADQQRRFSFRASEKRAQEERILHGMSITESAEIYQSDMRKYQQSGTHLKRQTTLTQGDSTNQQPAFQTSYHHVIR